MVFVLSFALLTRRMKGKTIVTADIVNGASAVLSDLDVSGYTADEKPINVMNMSQTISGKYLYECGTGVTSDGGYEKINLFSGAVSAVCDIPGCNHKFNTEGCKQNNTYQSPVAFGEDIYFVRGGSVIKYDGVTETEVLKNEYHTELAEQYYPENPDAMVGVTVHDKKIFLVSLGHFYIYDPENGNLSKPVNINLMADSLFGFCVTDSKVYYYDIGGFLYRENPDGTGAELVDEGVTAAYSEGNRVFYIKLESEDMTGASLVVLEDEGKPVSIANGCYVNFCATDGKVFYQKVNRYDYITVCDYEGKELADIHLGTETEPAANIIKRISGTNGISKVFACDFEDESKKLYIIDKKTLKADMLELG